METGDVEAARLPTGPGSSGAGGERPGAGAGHPAGGRLAADRLSGRRPALRQDRRRTQRLEVHGKAGHRHQPSEYSDCIYRGEGFSS